MSRSRKLLPLFDRVLVRKVQPQQTVGGIVLPESALKSKNEGTVVAVGPGRINSEGKVLKMNVNVGDQVLLSPYGGSEVELENETDLFLYQESDILGIFKKKESD
eukprot:CAMPEP_0174249838 /NCGR_PEP_ID=MMETSP0439-20130205/173_1 /TAXON_ID=0 /ORGANISM="Stereomyxa ramosa, Strain Chinc5" /LENGTH=104 /DNA_ID=CAMNT_0015329751 /DNA_START=62 /DNA_END=376 /DNA_ORIENTATION=-